MSTTQYKKIPAELERAADRVEQGKEIHKPVPKNRAAAALTLRIDGAGWGDIAEVLDFGSPAEARAAVERALASEQNAPEKVEQIRFIESRRIDRIITSLSRRATNPKDPDHLAYARTLLAAIKQQSDLQGATAPQKVDITYNPSAQQLEAWVTAVTAAKHRDVIEGDIIDVEYTEGE